MKICNIQQSNNNVEQKYLIEMKKKNYKHCVKSVQIRVFSGPYFPVFEYRKIRIRKISVSGHFLRSGNIMKSLANIQLHIQIIMRYIFQIIQTGKYQESRDINLEFQHQRWSNCFKNYNEKFLLYDREGITLCTSYTVNFKNYTDMTKY